MPGSSMRIVDCHTHIFPPEISQNRDIYLKKDARFSELYSNPKARLITAEELIRSMDDAEIDTSVVLNIGWFSHELCVKTNDYIIEATARHPQRLVGFATVALKSGDAALRELERCIRGGIKGIGEIRPSARMFEEHNSAVMDGLAQLIKKHNLTVLTHASEPVGHLYSGKGKATPDLLYRLILKYPDIKLVCAHWGGGLPFYELMPEVSQASSKVFYDTAASLFLYRMGIFQHVVAIVGMEKVLFGSDFPVISQKRFIQNIKALNLPRETEEAILGRNAERVLFGRSPSIPLTKGD